MLAAAAIVPPTARATARATDIDLLAGHRAAEAWQLEDAKRLAETWLAEAPEDAGVLELAAQVQHMRGEHLSALGLFEEAKRLAGRVRHTELQQRAWMSAQYAAHFETMQTAHFDIRYLNKDEIVAYYARDVLEAAYFRIGAALEFFPAEQGERIVVEIYPDARGLAGATGLTENEIETSGTIAVCKFHRVMIISPLATANGYGWADTLAHEFTHLVISKKSRNTIPIWLHEGIAKFYESAWSSGVGEGLSGYGENLLAEATRKSTFISYAQMHPSMAKLASQDDAALAFAEVFTTIEFLLQQFGDQSIPRVLTLAADGLELEAALRQVFSMDLQQIEKRWQQYLRRRPFREVPGATPHRIELTQEQSPANGDERPLEKIEDREVHEFARLGELLQLRGHHTAAVIEYERAHERSGVRYATIVNRLARAYVQIDRSSDALSILDEALRVHPDDADGHLMAGRLLFKREEWAAAKRHFQAVLLQNPFNPEIHVALTRIYGVEATPEAARRETHFAEIARTPRPTREYVLPERPTGAASVSITSLPWGPIRLDSGPAMPAPAYGIGIDAGAHSVEYLRAGGEVALRDFHIAAGEHSVVVVR